MVSARDTSWVVLSPHHDDAALSLGLTLLQAANAGVSVHVLNAFTISQHSPHRSLEGVSAVSAHRASEDADFIGRLPGAVSGDLGRRDAPLRGYEDYSFIRRQNFSASERAEILELALQLRLWQGHDAYFVPLALGSHIDHRVARAAAERAWSGEQLRYYEDLPYAAYKPEGLSDALLTLGDAPKLSLGGSEYGAEAKAPLIACYASQLSAAAQHRVLEHFGRIGGERSWSRVNN